MLHRRCASGYRSNSTQQTRAPQTARAIPQGKVLSPNVQQRDRDCRGKEQHGAQPAEARVKLRLRRIDREAAAGEQEHRKPFGLNHPRQRLFTKENQQNQPDKQRKQNI